jgi:L-galactose dehydrogenase/L-glyceraldehyde 3-phosphate reductase
MQRRMLGRTGLEVSAIGFGCGNTGGLLVRSSFETQRTAVVHALEGGINYFDTAAQYGDGQSEHNLGRVLSDLRPSVCIGTKLRVDRSELGDACSVVLAKLEEGLSRLGRSRVDVCTLHTRVGAGPKDLSASEVTGPIAEAMHNLVSLGLAGAIGFTGLGETNGLLEVAASGHFDVFQCYYNMLNQSSLAPGSPDPTSQDFAGILNLATSHGIGAVGIRALAGGALAQYEDRHEIAGPVGAPMAIGGEFENDRLRAMQYRDHLDSFNAKSLEELAIRFALSNPKLATVLIGFSDVAQVDAALDFESLGPLSDSTLEKICAIAR